MYISIENTLHFVNMYSVSSDEDASPQPQRDIINFVQRQSRALSARINYTCQSKFKVNERFRMPMMKLDKLLRYF